jgi:hypothetical protein
MRLFSESGVVERAFETASTFDAYFGAWSESFGFVSLLDGVVEYVGALCCDSVSLCRRPRGPEGDDVPPVANIRMHRCGSRSDDLAAGSMLRTPPYVTGCVNAV